MSVILIQFLFMDPMDVDAAQLANQNATKRRVETTLKATPGTGDTNVSGKTFLSRLAPIIIIRFSTKICNFLARLTSYVHRKLDIGQNPDKAESITN